MSRWNRSTTAASRKYSERSPSIAKMFDVNTMNGSLRHAENRRNGVDGEDQVGDLDEHEHEQQRRRDALARFSTVKKCLPVEVRAMIGTKRRTNRTTGFWSPSNSSSALERHAHAGDDEHRAEDVDDPVELGDAAPRRAR